MKVELIMPEHFTDEMKVTDEMDLSDGTTILGALRAIGVRPDEVIVLMDSTPMPLDQVLHDGDRLELLTIASGG